MLTSAAVCLRASSIKIRISINDSRGLGFSDPNLFASSSPFYYVYPITVTLWDIGSNGCNGLGGEPSGVFVRRSSRQVCSRSLHTCRGDGLLPHGFSPVLRLAKVCRILVANTAHWAGFSDSFGL